MLCSTKELDGFDIAANDGEIGHLREVYFDDERWVIRYLVVDAGTWLSRHEVLISPHSIARLDRDQRKLEVNLSRQQIKDAPGIDTDKPVARQHETAYHDYYGYPYYWGGLGMWGLAAYPLGGAAMTAAERDPFRRGRAGMPDEVAEMQAAEQEAADHHLRSSSEVLGYDVEASNGGIGHIDDFLFDEHSWAIRYAVLDTHNWLPDRLVLVAPQSIQSVDWNDGKVNVKLTREAVKSSPAYERGAPISEEEDRRLSRHYDTPSPSSQPHQRRSS